MLGWIILAIIICYIVEKIGEKGSGASLGEAFAGLIGTIVVAGLTIAIFIGLISML